MKDRIRQVMESKHMTQQQFAQAIDMAPATLSSIFNGRTKPTLNIVEAIKKKFPDISLEWLMFGAGEMQQSSPTPPSPSDEGQDEASASPGLPQEQAFNFDGLAPNSPTAPQNAAATGSARMSVRATPHYASRKDVNFFDKPQRQITEIRVYFDDLTFETFVPAKK